MKFLFIMVGSMGAVVFANIFTSNWAISTISGILGGLLGYWESKQNEAKE